MGAGASTTSKSALFSELEAQNSKPLDGSDVVDLEAAQAELGKLRQILRGMDGEHLKKEYQAVELMSTGALEETADPGETLTGTVDSSALGDTLADTTAADEGGETAVFTSNEYGTVLLSMIQEKMDQRFKSLRETFLNIDADRSGYISKEEFQKACSNWGVMLDEDFDSVNSLYLHQESEKMLDRGINYNEFIALMTGEMHYKPGEGEPASLKFVDDVLRSKVMDGGTTMRKAFNVADTDGSGSLEKNEMKAVFSRYHIECAEKEFNQFFEDYDRNGDGKFSYAEFVKLMQGNNAMTV